MTNDEMRKIYRDGYEDGPSTGESEDWHGDGLRAVAASVRAEVLREAEALVREYEVAGYDPATIAFSLAHLADEAAAKKGRA